MPSFFSSSDNSTPTANAGRERLNADPAAASQRRAGFFLDLAEILGDPRDLRDDSAMVSDADAAHDRACLAWAMQKPAMDAGLIPYKPRPIRSTPRALPTVRVTADRMCADGELMRLFDVVKQYRVSASVVRGWWSHHKIDGVTIYDGTNSLTLFYRAEIEAALKTWKPGKPAKCELEINDDDVPARIANAAQDFRTDASLFGSRVANGVLVAADSEGRSRHCRHGHGSHGCEPNFAASRVGKERRAREATFTNQEVA